MSKVLEYVDEQSVIDLTKRLIKSQSLSGNEKKLATLMAIEMKKAGFNLVQYDEHNNIVGVMPGLTKGKSLVLAGHIDTVPPGSMTNPFSAEEMDGSKLGTRGKVIRGRGACDMKGALAAMISTGSALKRARARLKGDFIVVGLAKTKIGKSSGLKALLNKFELKPDYIVSCNPTNMQINTAHPGQAIYRLISKGKMTNIGNPSDGDNAILKMQKIIDCIKNNAKLPEDKRFGQANLIISSIASNPLNEAHSVPYLCNALLVRQYFKDELPEKIQEDFISILKQNNLKEQDVEIQLERFFKPHEVGPKEEIIDIIQEAKIIATGKPANIGQWISGTNISEIFDVNYPIVGIGPGDAKFAHTSIEHTPVNQIIEAAKLYVVLTEKICIQMKVKEK
ncbi:MAG: M20/M25/M40 family metallo-hydrolase [Asgard group archaeon]|nr:M20/M25/M40 family metallo-hydrolase [Asgard group archaeon]